MTDRPPEEKWPSIDLAYEFVEPSYGWMLNRLNSANSRIQQLQAFAATVTFAAPILIRALVPNASFGSVWLILALVMFAATVGLGVYAIWTGTVRLPNPGDLVRHHIHKEQWKFKSDLLYRAWQAGKHNGELITHKWRIAVAMTVTFAAEVVFLTAWALTVNAPA